MVRLYLRGNAQLLFLLFFGLAALLAGATYQAYQVYEVSGFWVHALVVASTAIGLTFSILIAARVLYKAGVRTEPRS